MRLLLCLFCTTVLLPSAWAQPRYTLRLLDFLPWPSFSTVHGLNDAGDIAGGFTFDATGDGTNGAFRFTTEAGLEFLGSLDQTNSEAWAINNLGHVAGNSQVAGGAQWDTRGFVWTPTNGVQDIGTLGGGKTAVYGMNDLDQIVGASDTEGNLPYADPDHPFLFSPWVGMEDLGTLGGARAIARGINQAASVTGTSRVDIDGATAHAFLYSDQIGDMYDLGVAAGATDSDGNAINNLDVVAGTALFGFFRNEAAVATRDGMVSIGTLEPGGDSMGADISDRDVVVGQATVLTAQGEQRHAFIWNAIEGMSDLNFQIAPTNVVLETALKINRAGQILCLAFLSGDPSHRFPAVLDSIMPVLHFAADPDGYVLSWAPASGDYVLESTETLSPPAWLPVPNSDGGSVKVSANGTSQFFQLRRLSDEEMQGQFETWFLAQP